VEIAELVMTLD